MCCKLKNIDRGRVTVVCRRGPDGANVWWFNNGETRAAVRVGANVRAEAAWYPRGFRFADTYPLRTRRVNTTL